MWRSAISMNINMKHKLVHSAILPWVMNSSGSLKRGVSILTFWSFGHFTHKCTHFICKYSSPIDVCMLGLYTV